MPPRYRAAVCALRRLLITRGARARWIAAGAIAAVAATQITPCEEQCGVLAALEALRSRRHDPDQGLTSMAMEEIGGAGSGQRRRHERGLGIAGGRLLATALGRAVG